MYGSRQSSPASRPELISSGTTHSAHNISCKRSSTAHRTLRKPAPSPPTAPPSPPAASRKARASPPEPRQSSRSSVRSAAWPDKPHPPPDSAGNRQTLPPPQPLTPCTSAPTSRPSLCPGQPTQQVSPSSHAETPATPPPAQSRPAPPPQTPLFSYHSCVRIPGLWLRHSCLWSWVSLLCVLCSAFVHSVLNLFLTLYP